MKFAYADPPYLGSSIRHYAHQHENAQEYDTLEAHQKLIDRLVTEFPDGWALSMTSPNLHDLLPLCPRAVRIMAWVKPFAVFKPNVGVAYAWEPVIVCGGRKRTREQDTVRDWCAVNITLKRGVSGAKPTAFTHWLLDVLNAEPEDEIVDIFPGSGAVQDAIDGWREAQKGNIQIGLFEDSPVSRRSDIQSPEDAANDALFARIYNESL